MGLGDMLQAQRDAEDAARYRWLRRRIPKTIIERIIGKPVESWSEEQLDQLLNERMCRSETVSKPNETISNRGESK